MVLLEKTRTPSAPRALLPATENPNAPTAHRYTHVCSVHHQAEALQATMKACPLLDCHSREPWVTATGKKA